ncbi:MAG TPA: acyl-CoA dehydrogenase family protein [Kofleriaceae bacterium]|nr:acyl-CoA dehydrogenase family protein [Kofleriaceae bacterium]
MPTVPKKSSTVPATATSREVAEAARERTWRGESFLRDLFLGRVTLGLIAPFPIEAPERPAFREFYDALAQFLTDQVDPAAIDESGEYPPDVVAGLARLGAFGMKIPAEYGGLGLTHPEYVRCMELVGSHDGNLTALLSAHQAIGVPQPVKLFGTEEQKRKFLPRCARGAISAFALTEPAVGSDPASLGTLAEPTDDGTAFILNGEKLWCTNGTLAELIVVMARNPRTHRISAFVVDMDTPGVTVEHRCRFMGLRALANAVISFRNARIPRENLIGPEGHGLKIALTTLNTGRLSLPAATAGAAKRMLEIVRKWSLARKQWGAPVGEHEAITHKLAAAASSAFAMESIAHLVGFLADRPDCDIRLEAAAAKEWNTVRAWKLIDDTLQIRGGRGFETEASLAARGEPAIGVERAMRDCRINLIFEGASEIMHLFIAREAVDKHLAVAGKLIDPRLSRGERLRALPGIGAFYTRWFLGLLSPTWWWHYRRFGRPLAGHLRFVRRRARKLARAIFFAMIRHGAALERKQALLFRCVDIAMELFAITAAVSRAHRLRAVDSADGPSAVRLADSFARASRRRVRQLFRELRANDDVADYRLGREVLAGRHLWLEEGAIPLGYEEADMVPPTVAEILATEAEILATPPPPADAHRPARPH